VADPTPTVSRLAGQLDYLFDERPELRNAPVTKLRDWLNREDRMARAREGHPLDTRPQVEGRAAGLEDRFTSADIEAALQIVRRRRRGDD
jgi:hypothetical protein